MTIVAGFVNDDGVLLASDTLFSTETQALYSPKILPVIFPDGRALVGFCGEEKFCRSTIERLRAALGRYNGSPRPAPQIAESIRKTWCTAFRAMHRGGGGLWPEQIIAAIWSASDRIVRLYSSSNESFAESARNVECIGVGETLAYYLIGDQPEKMLPERQAFERAVRALGIVKAFMPTSIGGSLVAVNLNKNGEVRLYGQLDTGRVEAFTLELDNSARQLCSAFAAVDDLAQLKKETWSFLEQIISMRRQWRAEISSGLKDWAPKETAEIWKAFTEAGQPSRQSTTADPSLQPPSPESPGGSGES